ncbi:MAG: DUF4178 domain-containing protein [Lentisphaerae bacterium]|nr:DUF4178 domain-containing protein [Lentisphaerota bacterium]
MSEPALTLSPLARLWVNANVGGEKGREAKEMAPLNREAPLPKPFNIGGVRLDRRYTGEVVAIPGEFPKCAILMYGKLLTAEQFQEMINSFEGWHIDIKFHE